MKVTIITGTRAEYGLLKPLIKKIEESDFFTLELVVTGMHMSPEFGLTYKEIEDDGLPISYKFDSVLSSDSAEGISKSIAVGLISMADFFSHHPSDLVIVLGDRTEILAACIAAMIKGIPIAHISGGETTEGAYDEAVRHSITKMSYLHFTATQEYANRVIQLGEDPLRVFNTGAIGIDSIRNLKLMDKNEFENSIGLKLNNKNILVTFHPVTLEHNSSEMQFSELLESLDKLENTNIIFTKPNSDKGGRIIIEMIDSYVRNHPSNTVCFSSLGQLRYLSALQFLDVVLGNSSSGIVEVPYFKIPTINIGDRQKGRITPESVINCDPFEKDITEALKLAYDYDFREKVRQEFRSPYGDGHTTQRIFDIISEFKVESVKKKFYDFPKI